MAQHTVAQVQTENHTSSEWATAAIPGLVGMRERMSEIAHLEVRLRRVRLSAGG